MSNTLALNSPSLAHEFSGTPKMIKLFSRSLFSILLSLVFSSRFSDLMSSTIFFSSVFSLCMLVHSDILVSCFSLDTPNFLMSCFSGYRVVSMSFSIELVTAIVTAFVILHSILCSLASSLYLDDSFCTGSASLSENIFSVSLCSEDVSSEL